MKKNYLTTQKHMLKLLGKNIFTIFMLYKLCLSIPLLTITIVYKIFFFILTHYIPTFLFPLEIVNTYSHGI